MSAVLDTLITAVRTNLPPGITEAYLDGFVDRHRDTLLAILEEALGPPTTTKDRAEANLAAMALAASKPRRLTAAQKRTLSRYPGWGRLSVVSPTSMVSTSCLTMFFPMCHSMGPTPMSSPRDLRCANETSLLKAFDTNEDTSPIWKTR